MHWLTIWHRLLSDFWPFDRSAVAPNIVASVVQAVGVGVAAYALWPKLRRLVNRAVHRKATTYLGDIHAKLDHIITHHPDIPDFPVAKQPEPPVSSSS